MALLLAVLLLLLQRASMSEAHARGMTCQSCLGADSKASTIQATGKSQEIAVCGERIDL